jgi:outer membrane lipoprotein-sorting protein
MKMKKTMKRMIVLGSALMFLGSQVAFATEPTQEQAQDKKKEQTAVKECSDSKTKTTQQDKQTTQTRTKAEKAARSGK